MRVLQINCVYNSGSTGKIVHDIHTSLLDMGIDSYVCYGRGQKSDEVHVYKTSSEVAAKFNNVKSRYTGIPYNGSFFATNKLIKTIKKIKPDIVHIHCINGFFVNIYRLFDFLKKNKYKTVITNHAEFFYTGSCGYAYECDKWKHGCGSCPNLCEATNSKLFDRTHRCWQLMYKGMRGFDDLMITSVSPWVDSRATQSPIMKGYQHCTVMNGVDTNVFRYRDGSELRKQLKLEDKKVILHVTASFTSAVKGGKYVIELATRLKDENAVIVVIGNRQPYQGKLPENLLDIGRVENQTELAKYYSMADLSIISSRRETFSMPVAESLCCGTPIVGFKAGGPETIAMADYSEFVAYGDVELLKEAVLSELNCNVDKRLIADKAKDIYGKSNMVKKYIKIYMEL